MLLDNVQIEDYEDDSADGGEDMRRTKVLMAVEASFDVGPDVTGTHLDSQEVPFKPFGQRQSAMLYSPHHIPIYNPPHIPLCKPPIWFLSSFTV